MRDPDLVQRAERAAAALEKAWIHWRVRHGLRPGELPPVSSYVGYSMTEPWGQPRVVFGVDADEAERLAAILEGHDCVGPVHAEVASRPERWQQAEAAAPAGSDSAYYARAVVQTDQPALTHPVPAQPAQAHDLWPSQQPGPVPPVPGEAAPIQPPEPGVAQPVPPQSMLDTPQPGLMQPEPEAGQSAQIRFAAAPVAQTFPADPAAPGLAHSAAEDLTAEQPLLPLAMRQAAAMASPSAQLPADAVANPQDLAFRSAGGVPLPSAFPAAPVLPTPAAWAGAASTAGLPATADLPPAAGIQGWPDFPQPEELEVSHEPVRLTGSPGAHPWWPGMTEAQPPPATDDYPDWQGEDQVNRARLMPVPKLNRTRSPAAEAPEAGPWPQGVPQPKPTDTAV